MLYQQYLSEGVANEILKVNYILDFKKEEWPVLQIINHLLVEGTILTEKKSQFKKRLFKNYNSTFSVSVKVLANKFCLTFFVENLNQDYIPNNESIKKDVIELLIEVINNTKLLNKEFSKVKFEGIKEDLLNAQKVEKNSLLTLIDEITLPDYDYAKTLEKVTIDDVRDMYMKIITTGRIVVQEITSNEESGVKDLLLKELYHSTEKRTDFYMQMLDFNNMYVEKKSHLDPTRIDFLLQIENPKLTAKDFAIMQILTTVLNSYMFQIIREESNISYNPSAYFSVINNGIVLTANMPKEYKEPAITLIKEIVSEVTSGEVLDEVIIQAIEYTALDAVEENYSEYELSNFKLQDEILGIKELTEEEVLNITVEEVKSYAKNLKLKLIYYLGGK